jgi:putative holliday junction resolvase
MGKLLGIDYGEKRIGIAITDEQQDYIFPNETIENSDNIIEEIENIVKKENIETIVIGFPINMKGEEGFQSEKTKKFIEALQSKVQISVEIEDERLTSQLAERLLKTVPGGKKQKGNIDRQAAILILESYIGRNKK